LKEIENEILIITRDMEYFTIDKNIDDEFSKNLNKEINNTS